MTAFGNALRKAERRGLGQEAADRIRDAIFGGVFPPGAVLREVELAAGLEVSRGSVREALAQLEQEGLVRSAWHRGTRVIDLSVADVDEVYAVRAALERLAATSAGRRVDGEALAALEDLVSEMDSALRAGAAGSDLLALDIAFHDRIYAAAGNRRLLDAWHAVRSQVYLFQLTRVARDDADYRSILVEEHRELLALLRAGDTPRLAEAAEEHVDSARRRLVRMLAAAES
ncbi:GntR family transcriptional regulator [Streptomonospora sp. PA3]|uniref:GntR family transcriptional regulator n=1 Tax=Streptomonospora sp. PA3 TaxID=2607326 RepID=UPI0012DF14F5|nr:GntR family transcriptional regulator [Streptomonospora sp. PA3]MUL43924.1 GntR family transcriptional regulator [Streptomonospora sp. PA3]